MPIGTPVQIGTSATGLVVTTTTIVPSGATVFLLAGTGRAAPVTLDSVSGGGLAWAVDHNEAYANAFGWGFHIASAPAPSGLASATDITATFSTVPTGTLLTAVYCEGITDTAPKDVEDGNGQASGNWDTTATTTTVNDTLVLGGAMQDSLTTNTESGGASELADFQSVGDGWTMAVEYKILSGTGPASLTGTWANGGTGNTVSAFVAYKAAGGPPPATDTTTRRYQIRRSRMTSW